jgi:hypothetical protein
MHDCPAELTGELRAVAGDSAGAGGHARRDGASACPLRSKPLDVTQVLVAASEEQAAACVD